MKLTKEYLRKVIKEELESISEEEQGQDSSAEQGGATDAPAKRAGVSAVSLADDLVDEMLTKTTQLESRLKQLRTTQQ